MGNYLHNKIEPEPCILAREVDKHWMKKLRKWERDIQIKNSQTNSNANNSPSYLKQLNNWADDIKFDNFRKNKGCNNAPIYVLDLRKENELLNDTNKEFNKLYL
jgi:hypothetical protein